MALRVLRKINQATLNDLHDPTGEFHEDTATGRGVPTDFLYLDKKKGYFRKGYVDNDLPRPSAITEALMANTEEFAIFDDQAGIVKDGIPDLLKAEQIRASAKLTFSVDIDLPEEPAASVASTDTP